MTKFNAYTPENYSEALLVFMHRNAYEHKHIAKLFDVSEQTLSSRIKNNDWRFDELRKLKKLLKLNNPIDIAVNVFGTSEQELKSNSRERYIVNARQILMYYYHKKLGYSLIRTGRIFNKNHATVVHACNNVKNLIEVDKNYKIKIDEFLNSIEL